MLPATEHDILSQTRLRLMQAGRGSKAAIVSSACGALNCSSATLYRKLEAAGFTTDRKRRSDAGESVLSADQLHLVSGVLLASANKKGQRMPVSVALDILRTGGQLNVKVSESTVSRQLYQRRMHPEQLCLPTASVQLRSLHPNHVWQVDSTTGSYYYMPGGKLRWMPDDEHYKNKVHNLVKVKDDLLTRYAATDHTSGAFKVRNYLGGETIANLVNFLCWAMSKQDASPMHGVPLIIMMDPGGANRSHVMFNFCRTLGVELKHHASSSKRDNAARGTGSVEKTHDLVRMHYEPRLRFENPAAVTIERLNDSVESWAAAFCSSRMHSRTGRARYGVWMMVQPEQLRVASLQALQEAATREPETRRVSNDKTITYGSPSKEYDLKLVPGVVAGLRVTVVQNPFRAPAIDVLFTCPDTGAETWHIVEPAKHDQFGFREDSPVIGQEMRTAALSQVDRNRSVMTREAYQIGDGLPTIEEAARARRQHAQAYAGIVDAMADVKATPVPAYLPRRATDLQVEQRQVEAQRISVIEACQRIKERLGAAYVPQMYADVRAAWPDGVPGDQLDAIAKSLLAPAQPVVDNMCAIGGSAAA